MSCRTQKNPELLDSTPVKNNNIDRPTKHSLPLTKLTNLTSEWNMGCFCRLKKIYAKKFVFFFFKHHLI